MNKKKIDEIKINVQDKIFLNRNNNLKGLRHFIIDCLSHLLYEEFWINSMKIYIENRFKDPFKEINVNLFGINPNQYFGADWEEKVEKAGLGINLSLIEFLEDYNYIFQNARKKGADLLLIKNDNNIIFLESKGCTEKKCDGPISKGYSQVKKSFEKYTGYNILYGIVGCAAFSNKIHYFIKINNFKNSTKGKKMDNNEIRELSKISELISEAIKEKSTNNIEKSEKLYEEAAEKQYDLAISLNEKKHLRAIPNLISAGFCALNTENYELVSKIILKLDEFELNKVQKSEFESILTEFEMMLKYNKDYHIKKPLKYHIVKLIIKQYDDIQLIRGIGNIEKIIYAVKKQLIKANLYLPYKPLAAKAPIVIPEIKEFIDLSIKSGYIAKKEGNYIITEKGKEVWQYNIREAENYLVKKVPSQIQQKINELIIKVGKMTSKELKKWEKETFFITSRSYRKQID